MSAILSDRPALAGKYLTFHLDHEEYGVEILRVHEIIGTPPITRIPRTPDFVKGVIDLRGRIIPIIDLRAKFGMAPSERGESCVIVVQVRELQLGIFVDRVSEVAAFASADIAEPPSFGAGARTEYLLGIGRRAGRVTLLLDIELVLSVPEIVHLEAVASGSPE
jgi:purine-binding chemotaxis protein CheW